MLDLIKKLFCVLIDTIERMRAALLKKRIDLVQENYRVMSWVTGDNAEGKAQLEIIMDESTNFPAILTTSKLLKRQELMLKHVVWLF